MNDTVNSPGESRPDAELASGRRERASHPFPQYSGTGNRPIDKWVADVNALADAIALANDLDEPACIPPAPASGPVAVSGVVREHGQPESGESGERSRGIVADSGYHLAGIRRHAIIYDPAECPACQPVPDSDKDTSGPRVERLGDSAAVRGVSHIQQFDSSAMRQGELS